MLSPEIISHKWLLSSKLLEKISICHWTRGEQSFRLGVWQALRTIPVGTTLSYAELAHSIGEFNAVRAVAQVSAENAIAIAIPCHRVVRSDGALSGYRWASIANVPCSAKKPSK